MWSMKSSSWEGSSVIAWKMYMRGNLQYVLKEEVEKRDCGSSRRSCCEGYLLRPAKPLFSSRKIGFILLDWAKLTEKYINFYYCDSITEATEALVIHVFHAPPECWGNTHNSHYKESDSVFSWLKHQITWPLPFLVPRVPTKCSPGGGKQVHRAAALWQLCLPPKEHSQDRGWITAQQDTTHHCCEGRKGHKRGGLLPSRLRFGKSHINSHWKCFWAISQTNLFFCLLVLSHNCPKLCHCIQVSLLDTVWTFTQRLLFTL